VVVKSARVKCKRVMAISPWMLGQRRRTRRQG
jgi:hypothetical protein